jgi:hypothetical protein
MVRSAQLVLALVAPGAGLISARRVWRALALLFLAAATLTVLPGSTWPYSGRAIVGMGFDPWHLDLFVPLAVIYALSLWGHFAEQARIAARLEAIAQPLRPRRRAPAPSQEDGFSKEVA